MVGLDQRQGTVAALTARKASRWRAITSGSPDGVDRHDRQPDAREHLQESWRRDLEGLRVVQGDLAAAGVGGGPGSGPGAGPTSPWPGRRSRRSVLVDGDDRASTRGLDAVRHRSSRSRSRLEPPRPGRAIGPKPPSGGGRREGKAVGPPGGAHAEGERRRCRSPRCRPESAPATTAPYRGRRR